MSRRPRHNPPVRRSTPDASYGHPVNPADPDAKASKRLHWGVEPGQRINWHDRDLPRMVQLGTLVSLQLAPDRAGDWQKMITFRPVRDNHLALDARRGKLERLYLLVAKSGRRRAARWFDPAKAEWLAAVAKKVGGKQGKAGGYVTIKVCPVGYVSHVTYQTKKLPDDCKLVNGRVVGPGSRYIHEMGEDGGKRPMLCVSEDGRLWLAGGSQRVPTGGIAR
jgi:hypothetical protein